MLLSSSTSSVPFAPSLTLFPIRLLFLLHEQVLAVSLVPVNHPFRLPLALLLMSTNPSTTLLKSPTTIPSPPSPSLLPQPILLTTHQNQSPNSSPKSHLTHPSRSSFTLVHTSSIPLQSTSSSPSPLEALRTRLLGPFQHFETLLVSKILQQEDSSTTHFSVSSPGALDNSENAGRSLSIFGDEHVQGQNSPTRSYFTHPQ